MTVRLPPERQPAESGWSLAADVALALTAPTFARIELSDGVVDQLLQSAATLLQHAPGQCPIRQLNDSGHFNACLRLAALLNEHVVRRGAAADSQAQLNAAQHLLRAVQQLPTLLQLPSSDVQSPDRCAGLCAAWVQVTGFLLRVVVEGGGAVQRVQDVPAWCAAAAAMLRALPPALPLAQRAAGCASYADAAAAAVQLPDVLLAVSGAIAAACKDFSSDSRSTVGASFDETAAAADALWSLQTAGCRLAHCPALFSQLQRSASEQLTCLLTQRGSSHQH